MKKVLSVVLTGSLLMASTAFAFPDVPETHWAYDKIDEMHASNIISGFTDGTFRPDSPVTREQAASIMTNFFELPLKGDTKKFEDIPSGYWSEVYTKLVGQFMPINEKDGKYYFRPSDAATRIEIAETIVKILGFNEEVVDEEIIEEFNDKDSFSENDKKYIGIVSQNGIMVGDDKLNFRPNDTITRAEFCSLIYNIYTKKDELKSINSEKVAITVDGETVSYEDFELYFKVQRVVYENMFNEPDIWTMEINGESFYNLVKDATKSSMVSNVVRAKKAKELGVELTEDEIADMEEYLNEFEAIEVCEYYGITKEQLLKINLTGTLIEKLADYIYETEEHPEYPNLDEKVEKVYYDARHILLFTENMTDEEKEAQKVKAEELLKKVLEGEDFEVLAKEHSEDLGSKENGGLYEKVGLGEFVTEFEAAALATQVGMIYPEIVESPYGYHIIKLEGKATSLEELTEEEKLELINAYFSEVSQKWMEEAEVIVNEEVYKAL